MMKLTNRLQRIADLVENTEGIIADVGTDHGFVPIYLAKKFDNRTVYALDINRGPLNKAKENAQAEGLSDRIKFLLSDGLNACLEEKINTLIIAGMGGILVDAILERGKSCLTPESELILSPHGDENLVRKRLHTLGYRIVKEHYLKEAGQYYLIIYARFGRDEAYSEEEYLFGKKACSMEPEVQAQLLKAKRQEMESVLAVLRNLPEQSETVCRKQEALIGQIEYLKRIE